MLVSSVGVRGWLSMYVYAAQRCDVNVLFGDDLWQSAEFAQLDTIAFCNLIDTVCPESWRKALTAKDTSFARCGAV